MCDLIYLDYLVFDKQHSNHYSNVALIRNCDMIWSTTHRHVSAIVVYLCIRNNKFETLHMIPVFSAKHKCTNTMFFGYVYIYCVWLITCA